MLKVCAFTGGENDPSSRFRIRQYIPQLRQLGVCVDDFISRMDRYPPSGKLLRPSWACMNLLEHLPGVMRSYSYDVTLLQREMLSTFASFEHLTKAPRIFDIDDAIYLHRGGGFVKKIVSSCERVICGNRFLAERICDWQHDVRIIPTAVDTNRYIPTVHFAERPVIGWVGTSGNLVYLRMIEKSLCEVLMRHPYTILRVISNEQPKFSMIPAERCEFIRWNAEGEIAALQGLTIGIMPLADKEWERGKCSFKMLQYMSCALPVVASPVGMNSDVLAHDQVGFAAATLDDWVDQLDWLLHNPEKGAALGAAGRVVVQNNYSLSVLAPRLATALDLFAGNTSWDETSPARVKSI